MCRTLRIWVLTLGLCTALAGSVHAQRFEYSRGAEALFTEGVELFIARRYGEAVRVFDSLAQEYPRSHRVTAALVMKAKGLLLTNEVLAAAQTVRSILALYPSSRYVADAEFIRGLVDYRLQRYDDAMGSFLAAWRTASRLPGTERLSREIMEAINSTIEGHLQPLAVQRLIEESQIRSERSYLWLMLGQLKMARGDITGAAVAIDTLMLRYPENEYRTQIAALRQHIERRGVVKLGALLPLMQKDTSSPAKAIGNEIYEGIEFALEENARRTGAKVSVTLEVRDTERDPLVAMRGAQELTADDNILAIIGPVFSNTTAAVTSLTNRREVPLITPTANSNGIAAAGPSVFQANPDYDTRGKAIAQYAVGTRRFKTLAVLSPSEGYGRSMAEAFAAEATRLGGKIVATEWYERGATDLQDQLTNIRRAGLLEAADPWISFSGKLNRADMTRFIELGVPLKRIDSLVEKSATVPATMLLGPRAKQIADSLGLRVLYNKTGIDSLIYPVSSIDAIYIPIGSSDEIGVVSAQLVYFNIRTQVLGDGEWNDPAELIAQRRYCSNVIFESDSYFDGQSQMYTGFVSGFTGRFNKTPTKYTLYGYDTAQLIIGLIQSGSTTRDRLMRALSETGEYQGIHSKIGFVPRRVNTWLNILQYEGESIRKVAEMNVQ